MQKCWFALRVAELHKGGVISFRITQRKSNMQWLWADWFFRMETWTFIACKKQSQHHKTMILQHPERYFCYSVGIKCFCQCARKERGHLRIHDTFLKWALESYIKNGCWPNYQVPFCLQLSYLFLCLWFYAQLGGWHDLVTCLKVTHIHTHTHKQQQQTHIACEA